MTCGFAMPNPASTSLPNPASYDTSTPGVVLDNVTGLAWEKTLSSSSYSQSEAAAYCSSNRLGGWSDWRLPSVLELGTVMDFTQGADGSEDRSGRLSGHAQRQHESQLVSNLDGGCRRRHQELVRRLSERKQLHRHQGNGAGALRARRKGRHLALLLARGPVRRLHDRRDQHEAGFGDRARLAAGGRAPADGLVRRGRVLPGLAGSFRLPSIKEMQTIIDYAVASPGPTVNAAFPAPNPASYYYWSSSPLSGVPTGAWLMAVDTGSLSWNGQNAPYLARCVH